MPQMINEAAMRHNAGAPFAPALALRVYCRCWRPLQYGYWEDRA
jgi:hypothetical protein